MKGSLNIVRGDDNTGLGSVDIARSAPFRNLLTIEQLPDIPKRDNANQGVGPWIGSEAREKIPRTSTEKAPGHSTDEKRWGKYSTRSAAAKGDRSSQNFNQGVDQEQ